MGEPYTPRHAAQLDARGRRDAALREARRVRTDRKSAAFDAYNAAATKLRDAYFAECDAADRVYDETLSEVAAWFGGGAVQFAPNVQAEPQTLAARVFELDAELDPNA